VFKSWVAANCLFCFFRIGVQKSPSVSIQYCLWRIYCKIERIIIFLAWQILSFCCELCRLNSAHNLSSVNFHRTDRLSHLRYKFSQVSDENNSAIPAAVIALAMLNWFHGNLINTAVCFSHRLVHRETIATTNFTNLKNFCKIVDSVFFCTKRHCLIKS